MKRVLILTLLLIGIVFFSDAQSRRRPKKVSLEEYRAGRIIIRYAPGNHLTAKLQDLATRLESNLKDAETQIGKSMDENLNVYLFNNWEEKGNYSNDVRLAHADPQQKAIYCIVNEDWDGIAERPEFQILLNTTHGTAHDSHWEEYASAALAGVWFGKPLDDWESFLKSRDLLPEFPAILQDRQTSRFVRHPWAASLARFIRREYGMHAFLQAFKTGEFPADYKTRWLRKLSEIPVRSQEPPAFEPQFQKGISYSYWNSYDAGYATKKSQESLDKLDQIGVKAVASIPYGFMRANNAIDIRYPGHHIAGENDESLWALAEDAKSRNMHVMLKPQIWISHSSWPGNIKFESTEEWNLWIDNYEKWIVHYAIIAELTGADLFCIGTELVQATLSNPVRWRNLIEKVRKVYGGPLTYAANWGREFEGIEFWDALDYIGLDNYYPVRQSEKDGMPEMKLGFARQKEEVQTRAFRYCRPILFTEIGYMANNKAGMGMKEFEADPSDYDEEAQQAAYRLALETYWEEPWFAGMYWWKWFSEPNDSGRSADEHSPHGRKAQSTLSEWYRKPRS